VAMLPALLAQSPALKPVLELRMPKTAEDSLCGTRGASVCWNPVTKLYYAAFAGNKSFPLAVFNVSGKRISNEDLTTMDDIRGIWYDPITKKISANGYDDAGWLVYSINDKGIPYEINTKFSGMNQPGVQSVGTYDSKLKLVYFLDESRVMKYENFSDMFARVDDSVQIHWGRKKSQGPGPEEDEYNRNDDYNFTTVVATGITGAELGFLNTLDKKIELYDVKQGYLQQSLKLPADAPVESMFNFSYTNGIYWLFDIKNRKWIGYK
jgi:hypothetical protein